MKFYQILDLLVDSSGAKIKDYAEYLDYDSSYISKWLHDVNIPVAKTSELVLERSATFFTNEIFDRKRVGLFIKLLKESGENIVLPTMETEKKIFRLIILDLLNTAYMSTSHPSQQKKLKKINSLPYLNTYTTTDLDGLMSLLHSNCKHLFTNKEKIEIHSNLYPQALEKLLISCDKCYNMMLKSNQIMLNFYVPDEETRLKFQDGLTDVFKKIEKLNPRSSLNIIVKSNTSCSHFAFIKDSYMIIQNRFINTKVYTLIDNPELLSQAEDILHLK